MMSEYIDKSAAVGEGYLQNRFINSVSENDEPVWTEAHIEELAKDFIVIPNDTPVADVVRVGREPSGIADMRGKIICNGDILMCHNNPQDLCKAVLGEFGVIEMETFQVVDDVVGWHTEVIPTADPLSRVEPFCLTLPLNRFYIERGEMVVAGNVYDNPELVGGANG